MWGVPGCEGRILSGFLHGVCQRVYYEWLAVWGLPGGKGQMLVADVDQSLTNCLTWTLTQQGDLGRYVGGEGLPCLALSGGDPEWVPAWVVPGGEGWVRARC